MTTSAATAEQPRASGGGLSTRSKVLIFLAIYLAVGILLYLVFGSDGENEEFQPQEEFRLDALDRAQDRLARPLDQQGRALSVPDLRGNHRGDGLRRQADAAKAEPHAGDRRGRVRPDLQPDHAQQHVDAQAAAKWFPFVATLFFFIWFSNILGYIPLPTNDHETIDIFGFDFPAFALYAATANLSIPLILTLTVFVIYQVEGIRRHGFVKYLKGWLPAGVTGAAVVPIFIIEVISQFVRIISLSVRLFANILAGHLLILFMGGGLAVLLGITALGWITLPLAVAFFIFEVGLVATLQAFIFATLTSIYFGEASAGGH